MLDNPSPGAGSVPEYMISGIPWLTSSAITSGATVEYELPRVTSTMLISCLAGSAGSIRFGVTAAGVNANNYITISPGDSRNIRMRTKTLVAKAVGGAATFEVCASLTMISSSSYPKYDHAKLEGV